MRIPFNRAYTVGSELTHIAEAINSGRIAGNGIFTKRCQAFFETQYGFGKTLLTTSCTDALEMCAMLLDIRPGDEVIMPSFTFVSTALAFSRQGARIVFVDSRVEQPGMDEDKIEELITARTRAIVVVHYAGVSVHMDKVTDIARRYNLFVVEDAAHAIESFYHDSSGQKKQLGSLGHLGVLSFHETKNIQCGEGGLLMVNDSNFADRSEVIWEKGTNRAAFFRGEIEKYSWIDTGSSFLPSDINAAYLWGQLEKVRDIQAKRMAVWESYQDGLHAWAQAEGITLPVIPPYATNNAHMFYLVCASPGQRVRLLKHLNKHDISAVFHYQSLHASPYYRDKHDGRNLPESDRYSECLFRLPFYVGLDPEPVIRTLLS